MAGTLQADATLQVLVLDQAVPLTKGDRLYQTFQQVQKTRYVRGLATDAEFECIFKNQREQLRGRLATEDRAAKACGQQCRNATDMVEVHMGDHQRLDAADIEAQRGGIRTGIGALLKPAIDEQAGGRI